MVSLRISHPRHPRLASSAGDLGQAATERLSLASASRGCLCFESIVPYFPSLPCEK